jgi:hypothetical protein
MAVSINVGIGSPGGEMLKENELSITARCRDDEIRIVRSNDRCWRRACPSQRPAGATWLKTHCHGSEAFTSPLIQHKTQPQFHMTPWRRSTKNKGGSINASWLPGGERKVLVSRCQWGNVSYHDRIGIGGQDDAVATARHRLRRPTRGQNKVATASLQLRQH